MKTIIFNLFILFMFASCEKQTEDMPGDDTLFHITVKSSEGTDLLDPSVENCYNPEGIRVFDIINGESIEYYDEMMGAKRGFRYIDCSKDSLDGIAPFSIRPFLRWTNRPDGSSTNTFSIKWPDNSMDTIKCEVYEKYANLRRLSKVYVNNKLKWEGNEDNVDYRHIEIIKN